MSLACAGNNVEVGHVTVVTRLSVTATFDNVEPPVLVTT